MGLKRRFDVRVRRAFRHMAPNRVAAARKTRGVIERFAEKVGLVYFGAVDQRDDEHRLIRGHTVSATHIDSNYCVGTVRGYDVTLNLRNDVIVLPTNQEQRCHWLMYTIDLHTSTDIPAFYVGHRNRDEAFRATYRPLRTLMVGATGPYPAKFIEDYTVYGSATNALAIEQTVTPVMAQVIAERFDGVSFEIDDNTIYMYIENEHPSEAQLEAMLSNGLWLAESIDAAHTTPPAPYE